MASGLWWLHISMHQFGGIPWVLAALAVGLLAAFLGSYYALALGLTARWIAPGRARLLALVPLGVSLFGFLPLYRRQKAAVVLVAAAVVGLVLALASQLPVFR